MSTVFIVMLGGVWVEPLQTEVSIAREQEAEDLEAILFKTYLFFYLCSFVSQENQRLIC